MELPKLKFGLRIDQIKATFIKPDKSGFIFFGEINMSELLALEDDVNESIKMGSLNHGIVQSQITGLFFRISDLE